jgi:SnoaL-like polyketide cyclase
MSIEAFTRLFDEVFSKGNLDAADQLVAPEIIDHQFAPDGSPGRTLTRDQFTIFVRALRAGIPDLHYTVEDAAAAGDKVWLRVRARGTDAAPSSRGLTTWCSSSRNTGTRAAASSSSSCARAPCR